MPTRVVSGRGRGKARWLRPVGNRYHRETALYWAPLLEVVERMQGLVEGAERQV